MRWSNGEHEWHRWFAWYPKTIVNQATNEKVTVWWEHIARREIMGNFFPYYIYNPDPTHWMSLPAPPKKGDE
jgi:hypothetical protein